VQKELSHVETRGRRQNKGSSRLCVRINLAFDAAFHVVDDELIFVAGGEGDAQELGWVDVLLTEELAVAASAVHQVGGQGALKLGTGLDDQAREPDDAGDLVGLGRKLLHLHPTRGRLAV
jgi:hypothetical protein